VVQASTEAHLFVFIQKREVDTFDGEKFGVRQGEEALHVKYVSFQLLSNIYGMTGDRFPFLCLASVCYFLLARQFLAFSTNATPYPVSFYPACPS